MTQKELQDTVIVTGLAAAYIAKKNKSDIIMSEVRREITEREILGLIVWYSKEKFKNENTDFYNITLDGKPVLTIKKLEE